MFIFEHVNGAISNEECAILHIFPVPLISSSTSLSLSLFQMFFVSSPGRPRRRLCGGDDGAAEPPQAVLRAELAHPGLRRPQRDGAARGAGLALQTAGGCWRPGRGLKTCPPSLSFTDSPLSASSPSFFPPPPPQPPSSLHRPLL